MARFSVVPLLAAFIVVSACGGSNGDASTQPAGTPAQSSRALHLVKVGDFDSPVFVTSPPGDRRRVLVVEQGGRIRVVRGGQAARAAVPGHQLARRERRGAGVAVDGVRGI